MSEPPDNPIAAREVLLCVSGGIACYKAADLASKLVQAGAGVSVAMTDAATRFVAPLTFGTLTRRRVFTSLWTEADDFRSQHIALTELADLMIVAPATADLIAKIACGLADDLVSTLALSAFGECPILIAPAMNSRMWHAPATQANIERVRGWGLTVVGPDEGRLACGTIGPGRMIDPAEILASAADLLHKAPPKKA